MRIVSEGGSLQATPKTNPQSAHTSRKDVINIYVTNKLQMITYIPIAQHRYHTHTCIVYAIYNYKAIP